MFAHIIEGRTADVSAGILWAARYEASDDFMSMLEFHMSCTDHPGVVGPGHAHIRHIIYRDTAVLQLTDYSPQPNEAFEASFSSLLHLQTVTVEARSIQLSDISAKEDMPTLRDQSGKRRLRTWKEAHDLTQGAIRDGSAEGGSLPISPLWAHPRHKRLRERWQVQLHSSTTSLLTTSQLGTGAEGLGSGDACADLG